jgi:hypothetical protein
MKPSSLLTLALAGLALASSTAAQNAPVPVISSIPNRKPWAPGNLVVNGSNLGLALQVKLDGQTLPIIRVGATRLVAGPLSPRDPGFGLVELVSGRGVESGTVEFVPTLTAARRGLRLSVRLNNGEPGTYLLRYSYSPFGPVSDPGIYGPRFLPTISNTLFAGIFPTSAPVTLNNLPMPIDIGLIGRDLRLQATCTGSVSNVTAYTNKAQVPGFGDPKGGG